MDFRAFVHSRMRSLRIATKPWITYGRRKPDHRAKDDPLRKVHLHAKGRKFQRDSTDTETTSTIMVSLMALMAMAVGYRLAHMWKMDAAGTLLSPFVLVAVTFAVLGRSPLGLRILALFGGLVFLLWPILKGIF